MTTPNRCPEQAGFAALSERVAFGEAPRRAGAMFWLAAVSLLVACACSSAAPATLDAGAPATEADSGDAGVAPPADAGDASDAAAPPLGDASGFFDVPARGSVKSAGRMFYVFLKSDVPHAPLVVFSNGGPGYATSFGLLPHGTGREYVTTAGAVQPNPGSWTSFANVLYIDERQSGFSYDIGTSTFNSCHFDSRADAADFVRGLLDFLDGHPALTASPVVIAGESYGGTRTVNMLDLLLHYREEAPLVDTTLANRIQQHYDRVFPGLAGTTIAPATAAQQFGSEVLLQPFLGGQMQVDTGNQLMASDPWIQQYPQPNDGYDVRKPPGWSESLDPIVAKALVDPASDVKLLGVDLALVPRIGAADRKGAFRTPPLFSPTAETIALNASLASRAGALATGDEYVRVNGAACSDVFNILDTPAGSFQMFADNLRYVRTFITHARYDAVVYAPAIPYLLTKGGYTSVVDDAPRPGVARPGWFKVSIPASGSEPAKQVEVRFPDYDNSGHMVEITEPVHLRDDVAAWLSAAP